MTVPRKKKPGKARQRKKRVATRTKSGTTTPLRAGLPAADSVRAVVEFVSPQKVRYTILKTTEMDAYDKPVAAPRKSKKNRTKE